MKNAARASLAAAALLAVASTASADVQVAMNAGRVTIVAKDATVRQILAEWARVGQTKIVNGERIAGGPVTLELRDLPEQQALNILLRTVSGFVLAPRVAAAANASVFDRIIVLPTASAPAPAAASSAPPAFAQPSVIPPPLPTVSDDQDDRPPNPSQPGTPVNRGPVFVFPQPQISGPQAQPQNRPAVGGIAVAPQQSAPSTTPGPFPGASTVASPVGVSVPGMVVPAPTPAPGQLVQPIPPQREQ